MKLLLLICLLGLARAQPTLAPVSSSYHESTGIPQARLIKAAEEAADFDGSRIIGGSPATLGSEPYMVGMVITLTTGATSVCGGALISNSRALTAARCWWDGTLYARQAVLVLGSTTLFSGGTRVTVGPFNVLMHENYNIANLQNDIAMILTPRIEFTTNISSIPLIPLMNTLVSAVATLTGYGETGHNLAINNQQSLRSINLTVMSNADCQVYYGSTLVPEDTKLCTRGGAVCPGDAGSPLVAEVGGVRSLVAVVSFWSSSGCHNGFPTGYTRISSYIPWIQYRL